MSVCPVMAALNHASVRTEAKANGRTDGPTYRAATISVESAHLDFLDQFLLKPKISDVTEIYQA